MAKRFFMAGAIVSAVAVSAPIHAAAFTAEDQLNNYFNAASDKQTEFSIKISSGDTDISIESFAIQSAALELQKQKYAGLEIGATVPAVEISAQQANGAFYQYNDKLYPVTVVATSGTINIPSDWTEVSYTRYMSPIYIVSQHFALRSYSDYNLPAINRHESGRDVVGYGLTGTQSFSGVLRDTRGFFTSVQQWSNVYRVIGVTVYHSGNVPIVNPAGAPPDHFGAGVSVSIPSGTGTPWDYYNNILLPFLRSQGVPDSDIWFPSGYEPPPEPPTVPPESLPPSAWETLPTAGGSVPAGLETMAFDLPDVPQKDIYVPAFSFPEFQMPDLRGIWALIQEFMQTTGIAAILPFAVACLCIAIIVGVIVR